MRFGHFDDENREYVIDRPDTPRSWSNYSGSRRYGAVISNNAGGYSFYRTSAIGRHLRLRFNSVPMDQPGRYFYLRDRDTGDYWSASWQPVGKPLSAYSSTCRFGTSYTVITSSYADITSESTYFVPLDQAFEYWMLTLSNTSKKTRKIDVFTFCEFTSEWNIFEDNFNSQYSAYTVETRFIDNMVRCSVLGNVPADKDNFANGDQGRWCWMAMLGAKIAGYELDREQFIGPYRSYHNPLAVERGACNNSTAYGDNACGCMQTTITLKPGGTRDLLVLLGIGKAEREGRRTVKTFGTVDRAKAELAKVKKFWHARLNTLAVDTPDQDFNHMVNVWNAYNALITFSWSRAASFVYTGDNRDGFGYRDTVQDLLGAVSAIPDEVRERLELMITGQESTGGARPEIKPWLHKPGQMGLTKSEHYRSDDCLWLFNAVPAYVAETGDTAFYNKVLPYSDKGSDTVMGHLRRALEFNIERSGAHDLPCGLLADWNDCLKLGFKGESVFVAFQVRYGLVIYGEIADLTGRPDEKAWAQDRLKQLDAAIQRYTWDGRWFVRAFREDGSVIGSKSTGEGRIFLNTQSWSVISGAADGHQAGSVMNSVEKHLETEHGLMICTPPFVKTDYHVVRAVLLNPGQKENGGIFSHTQSWAVIADAMLGNGDRAYRHYRAFMPARYNDLAEVREIEPYVHCQSTDSIHSGKPGHSHIPWLSGTASWACFTAAHYILGIRPVHNGLVIDPCIPSAWKRFSAVRRLRGRIIEIEVSNPHGVQKGVAEMTVNGQKVDGIFVAESLLTKKTKIKVRMGC